MKNRNLLLSSALILCAGVVAMDEKPTDTEYVGSPTNNITPSDKSAQVIMETSSGARLSIGGFVRYDLIYDSIRTGSDPYFVTSLLPVEYDGIYYIDNTAITESKNYVSSNAIVSQIRLIATPPKWWGDDTYAFVEGDFSGQSGGFDLRHAYGENRRFIFGQTWSNMMDIRDFPAVLEWQGPNIFPAARPAQADIKFYQDEKSHTIVAVEDSILAIPLADYASQGVSSANYNLLSYETTSNSMPTFVLAQRTDFSFGHIHVGAAYNSVTIDGITSDIQGVDEKYTVHGWQVNTSGTIELPMKQKLQFYGTYDQGLSSSTADLYGTSSYVLQPNADGSIDLVTSYGAMLAYYFQWSKNYFTQLSGSMLNVGWDKLDDVEEISGGDAEIEDSLNRLLKSSYYASINLVWQPKHGFSFGGEYVYGQRTNRDDKKGYAHRVHLVTRISL